ncbi:DoxX family protein [Microvirga vignae]|uniref:DoxX family protein n=1 Tax=Microvirga vignae TaxID=1225564 RepID=A0A0H1RIY1_9HYPH|nr:DoxX family protein [Microvirga vignae]KLK92567.1 DoxX family protein [Microvirga vignae]
MSISATALPLPSKVQDWAAWALQLLLAAAFLAAGGAKLSGADQMVQVFEAIGVGEWFRYVTGLIEVIGAMALLIPGSAAFGAAVLACTMVGAVFTHQFVIGGSAVPAIALLVLALSVVWLRRRQILALVGR